MSSQPITQHDEQTTDPQVRARLVEACDNAGDLAAHVLRERIVSGARSGLADFMAKHGAI